MRLTIITADKGIGIDGEFVSSILPGSNILTFGSFLFKISDHLFLSKYNPDA